MSARDGAVGGEAGIHMQRLPITGHRATALGASGKALADLGKVGGVNGKGQRVQHFLPGQPALIPEGEVLQF